MTLSSQVIQLNISDIISSKNQPRKIFDTTALDTLCESISKYGIIQPLIVRKINDKYEIVSGERRYRAAKKIGMLTVPALVGEFNDVECMELSLVENLQNKSLNPLEEGKAFKKILDTSNMSIEDLEKNTSVSKDRIQEKIKLLDLDKEVQKALLKNDISESHAKLLLKLDLTKQVEVLNKIINDKLTVKETNDYINSILKEEVNEMNSNMSSALNNLNIDSKPSNIFNDEINVIEKRNDNMNNNQNMFFGSNFQSLENQSVNMNTQPNNNINQNQQMGLNNNQVGSMINIPTPSFATGPVPTPNSYVEPTPIVPPTPVDMPSMTYQTPIMPSQVSHESAPKEQPIPVNPFMNLETFNTAPQPTPQPIQAPENIATPQPAANIEQPVPFMEPPVSTPEQTNQFASSLPPVNPFATQPMQPEMNSAPVQTAQIPENSQFMATPQPTINTEPSTPFMEQPTSVHEPTPMPKLNNNNNNNNTVPNPFAMPEQTPTTIPSTMTDVQLDNAISEVRMAVKNLENRGITVKLVENDLGTSYQIVVEIQK